MRTMVRGMKMGLAASLMLGSFGAARAAEKAPPAGTPPAKTQRAKKPGISAKPVIYQCKACNVASDKPGKCPKCGMDMKLVEEPKPKPKAKGGKTGKKGV